MAEFVTKLLNEVPKDTELKVRTTRDRVRSVLQKSLRAECRLVMRTREESEERRPGARVPVHVDPGYPAAFEKLEFPDELKVRTLLSSYRTDLENVHTGILSLRKLSEELSRLPDTNIDRGSITVEPHFASVTDWIGNLLKELDNFCPLKGVLSVNEDILGVYEYDLKIDNDRYRIGSDIYPDRDYRFDEYSINTARIRLYWMVIGLVSQWIGCSVEALTIVVLTHEYAHAYAQLGADIEGRRWPAQVFDRAEIKVKEGLAQYYTERVLSQNSHRYPAAYKTYEKMLRLQPPPYRVHRCWLENFAPESVRFAMLKLRRRRQGGIKEFVELLNRADDLLKDRNR